MRTQTTRVSPVTSDYPADAGERAGQQSDSRSTVSQDAHVSALALRPKGNTISRMQAFLAQQDVRAPSRTSARPSVRQTIFDLVKLTNERRSAYPAELIGVERAGRNGRGEVELRLDRFLGAFLDDGLAGFLDEQHQHGVDAEKEFLSDAIGLFEKFRSTGLDQAEQHLLLTWLSQQYGAPEGGYVAEHISPLLEHWETRAVDFKRPDDFAAFVDDAVVAIHAETTGKARNEFMQVLLDTIDQYDLDKTSESYAEILRMWHDINEFPPGKAVSERRLVFVMDCVCEVMQSEAHMLVKNAKTASDAPRDAKRMPNDCAIQWAARLRDLVNETSDATIKRTCQKEFDAIFQHFLQHRLTFGFTRNYFALAKGKMEKVGCDSLAQLAEQLLNQLPGPEHDDFDRDKAEIIYKTALHDNPYGRVFGTRLCKQMLERPSAAMMETLSQMSDWLSTYIFPDSYQDEQGQLQLHLSYGDAALVIALRTELAGNELNWRKRMPAELQDFLATANDAPPDVNETAWALQAYFDRVYETPEPIDLIALPHLMFKAMVVDPRPDAPWVERREEQYAKLGLIRQRFVIRDDHPRAIRAAAEKSSDPRESREMRDAADDLQYMLRKASRRDAVAGITLAHQPPAFQKNWMSLAPRPSNAVIPNFAQHPIRLNRKLEIAPDDPALPNRFSMMEKNRLRHGEAFGTDLSGVCNFFLHALDHAAKHGQPFDFRQVVNIIAIYLNLDGGHDPSEC